jgi:hypothetical protein
MGDIAALYYLLKFTAMKTCLKPFVLLLTASLITALCFSQEFKEVTGKVVTAIDKTPIPGVTIINTTSKNPETNKNFITTTDRSGEFKILAKIGDVLEAKFVGMKTRTHKIEGPEAIQFRLEADELDLDDVVVVGYSGLSTRSTWIGAKVGYNFDGIDEDNEFIGAAKISINPFKERFSNANGAPYISIIGNFGDFISNAAKDTVQKKLSSLALSTQGLAIGLGATWELPMQIGTEAANRFNIRPYVTSGYRLNTFKNVRIGKDSTTINLSQFRNTAGIELEGFEFKNGGLLNISIEAAITFFDPVKYEQIFNEQKRSLKTLEGTIILPISNLIGFFVDGTFARNTKPIYLIGIIFKSK